MGVTYLLDTHVFVWLLTQPKRLPAAALETLSDPSVPLLVSAASAMEVSTKVRLGKFDQASALVDAWVTHVSAVGAVGVPITPQHALLAGRLAWNQRDPFDRLLAATALLDNHTLVTADAALLGLPGLRVLRV
ncbi:MAG: hypothetical protein RLZ55_1444 [Actinomycetota bacterium]